MASTLQFLLLLAALSGLSWAQAPGDEDRRCTVDHTSPATYPDTERNLMDSYNYQDLLPGNGTGNTPIATAVWNDYSFDGNDYSSNIISQTYWQQGAGGICRFQSKVCGWRKEGTQQNNWLFTQHIRQNFDSSTYNYNVSISVRVTYSVQSCRERLGCRQGFDLLHYITNSAQLPSLSESGFMNTINYQKFAEPYAPMSLVTYTNTYTFTLPPSSTGFYIAAQDTGSCAAISRLRVYRNNCKSFDTGLVKYPDAPAPVSGTAAVKFSCVPNGGVMGIDTVGCTSEGTWVESSPQCGCNPGYEIDLDTKDRCDICPVGEYQPMVSGTNRCKQCPSRSSTRDPGTAVCPCEPSYIRHPDRPDDPCVRSPSPPLFDLAQPPELEGTKVTAIWKPPSDSGGDPDGLYFDVYTAQLVRGEDPTFCRENEEPISDSCNAASSECRYEITSLDSNTPYAILVVAANSATDDPECVSNFTVLGSRYLVMVVGTEDAIDASALSAGEAAGITFIVTLIVTAVATAAIVIVIFFVLSRRRSSHSGRYSTNGKDASSTTMQSTTTTTTFASLDKKPPAIQTSTSTSYSKPSPARKPGRPVAPPPKPSAPQRPALPSRPHAAPTYNGY